jgi:hypothetical protein
VREGIVTRQRAAEIYAVVIGADLTIDEGATAELRSA